MTSPFHVEPPTTEKKPRAGFTLVELLVSITVSALLLTVLLTVIFRSLQVSQQSADAMTAYSSAATAVDLVATDLASLAVNRQPFEYLQARPESAAFQGIQPMRLMFLLDSPEDSAQSSPSGSNVYPDSGQTRAVSYVLAWQNSVSSTVPSTTSNSVFGLYRQAATTADTFKYALGTSDLYTALYTGTGAALQIPPALTSFVAGNLVDFQVAFYANPVSSGGAGNPPAGTLIQPPVVINGSSVATPLPYQKTRIGGTQTLVNDTVPTSNGATYGPVVYVEVSLTLLEEAGAKLWGDGTGLGSRSPAAIKLKYGHTITRKITLRTPQ